MKTQHTPGTRLARNGQFVPTIDGKDTSPTSFDEERALQIAKEQIENMAANDDQSKYEDDCTVWHVKHSQRPGLPTITPLAVRLALCTGERGNRSSSDYVADKSHKIQHVLDSSNLIKVLEKQIQHTEQLAAMVNRYANQLELGNKIHAEDWTDKARQAIAKAKGLL